MANYYLELLDGHADVGKAVFLAPEARGCDGAGFLAQYGLRDLPVTPVDVLEALPFLVPVLTALSPELRSALQPTPPSEVYRALTTGPITQPGVRYSVMSSTSRE